MIFFLICFGILIFITSFLILKVFHKRSKENFDKKKLTRIYFLSISIITIFTTFIYMNTSNYWLGNNMISKMFNYQTKENQKALDLQLIKNIIEELEKNIEKDPNNVNLIEKIAQAKFFIGDFSGSKEAYEKLRSINPDDLEYLIGEANSRLFLEENKISEETVDLFTQIIIKEPDNTLALAVLAENLALNNKNILSKKYYLRLLKLLEKDSLEYKNIQKKLNEVESKLDDKKF